MHSNLQSTTWDLNHIPLVIMGKPVDLIRNDGFEDSQWEDLAHKWNRCIRVEALDSNDTADQFPLGLSEDSEVITEINQRGGLCSINLEQLEETLSTRLTLKGIEHSKGHRIMIHACGFSNTQGDVIALSGPSGTGKTTLSNVMGTSLGYITDETICVDFDGTVHPYPKPLSIIWKTEKPKVQVSPDELGHLKASSNLNLKYLILLNRDPEAEDTVFWEDVDLFDSIVELIPEQSYMSLVEQPLQRLKHMIDSLGGVKRVTYKESTTLAVELQRLMNESKDV